MIEIQIHALFSSLMGRQECRIHEHSNGGVSWLQNRMKETNLQLHSIDAHIHRAALSLDHLSQIIDNLQKWQPEMDPTEGGVRSRIGLEHIAAQVNLYVARARELKGRNSILINLVYCPLTFKERLWCTDSYKAIQHGHSAQFRINDPTDGKHEARQCCDENCACPQSWSFVSQF